MDDFEYGIAQCALQVTLEAVSLAEARRLHDFLVILSPLMLALSAAVPIYRGYLVESDTRWGVLCVMFGDQNQQGDCTALWERPTPMGVPGGYLGQRSESEYSEADVFGSQYDAAVFDRLVTEGGIDAALAMHWARVLDWRPLKLTGEDLTASTSHLE